MNHRSHRVREVTRFQHEIPLDKLVEFILHDESGVIGGNPGGFEDPHGQNTVFRNFAYESTGGICKEVFRSA